MSVDTARDKWVPKRYKGECECPRCGQGSKTLKAEALPIITGRLGNTVRLHCDICGHDFLAKEGDHATE